MALKNKGLLVCRLFAVIVAIFGMVGMFIIFINKVYKKKDHMV